VEKNNGRRENYMMAYNCGSAATFANYRILCVDDDASVLKLQCLILEEEGYLVSAAGTVADALALFRSMDFDVVVTDHLLGRESGVAMSKEMKRIKSNVSIILISGLIDAPEGIDTVDAFITKGRGCELLLAKVAELAGCSRTNAVPAHATTEEPSFTESETSQVLATQVGAADSATSDKTIVNEDLIRSRAYERYEERGRIEGYDAEDWLRAEAALRQKHQEFMQHS
jgi:DNA-binding response OmpR family regulator